MPARRPAKNACVLPPLGMDASSLCSDTRHYLFHTLGAEAETGSKINVYTALSMSLRDRLVERWKKTQQKVAEEKGKRTFYLSLEFCWAVPWVTPCSISGWKKRPGQCSRMNIDN